LHRSISADPNTPDFDFSQFRNQPGHALGFFCLETFTMPQPTSSIQTGALTLSAASLVPIIDWGASRAGVTIPVDVQLQLAALLITGAHAIYNLVRERLALAPAVARIPGGVMSTSVANSMDAMPTAPVSPTAVVQPAAPAAPAPAPAVATT